MKKSALILAPILVALAVLLVFYIIAAKPTTATTTALRGVQTAVYSAGLQMVGNSRPEYGERVSLVSLPLGLRLRYLLHLDPRPSRHSEAVQDFILQTVHNRVRSHCLVRYSEGKVVRIVVRYPVEAKREAIALRDALRKTFPKVGVSLNQTNATSKETGNALR